MSLFGDNLKSLMKARRINSTDLSLAIGTPAKSIHEWLNKDRFPRDPAVLKKLSLALDCSLHRLLYGVEDSNDLARSLLEKTEVVTGLYEITIRRVVAKN